MEDYKIKPLSEEDMKAQEDKKSAGSVWLLLIIVSVVLVIITVFFFVWNQPRFLYYETINHDLFGTFGDFVGGFIGTIVAVFSVYFLVQTLRSQIDSNAETVKSNRSLMESNEKLLILNNLQLFDNQFQSVYNQYLLAIDSYRIDKNITGRKALEQLVKEFLEQDFETALEYKRRSQKAVTMFDDFYAENRTECSVHFRVLYLLVCLIAEADIDEESRVMYAKCIRGQLSEGEMAVIRYNCMTANGTKMQQFINQFNLLKHLPLMSIFEFRQWKSIIEKEELLSAIDTLFIALKKGMTNLNDLDDTRRNIHEVSTRYKIDYGFEDNHRKFTLKVSQIKEHKKGGGVKRPLAEKAFDCLNEEQLTELFEAFLHEAFITGSFGIYNSKDCKVCPSKKLKNDKDEFVFEIAVIKDKKLVLAERQVVPGT